MLDVVDLREFYASPLGQMTRRMLSHRIRSRFRTGQGARVLGVGYALPYLEPWRAEAERVFAFMPARQGVVHWPQSGLNVAALVEEADLPLPDASIDLALLVHGLELTDQLPDLLRELWRVPGPPGRGAFGVAQRGGEWGR